MKRRKTYFGILIIFIIGIIIISSQNICFPQEELDTSCFEDFQTLILKKSTNEINFSKQITCFEWDRLEIGMRGSYENYPCTKFHQICKESCGTYLGKDLESHMGWLDRDRHWTFIYFYKDEKVLHHALAIPESVASFDELKGNKFVSLFYEREDTQFKLTDFEYGGISGKQLLNHRQLLKK